MKGSKKENQEPLKKADGIPSLDRSVQSGGGLLTKPPLGRYKEVTMSSKLFFTLLQSDVQLLKCHHFSPEKIAVIVIAFVQDSLDYWRVTDKHLDFYPWFCGYLSGEKKNHESSN